MNNAKHFRRTLAVLAAILVAGGLQACGRGADSGATTNPVAPGRPGTGNGVEHIAPKPTSIPESPALGGSTQRIPEGVTGSGSASSSSTTDERKQGG